MRAFHSLLLTLLAVLSLACGRGRGAPGPAFSLTVEPGQMRLLPGLSQTVALKVQPEPGFSGEVELSTANLGLDLEARFTPGTLVLGSGLPAQATLVLTAKEEAVAGKRSLTLLATGSDRAESVDLTVDIPVVAFFTVMTYRGNDPANFAYLAYQDGDGPWLPVPGNAGLYRLPVTDPGGKFGVLLGDVCRGETASTWVSNGFFSTLGEVQLLQALVFCNPQPGPPPETFDLSGTLAGAPNRSVLIGANSGLWSFPVGATDYALKLLRGTGDLVAAAYPSTQDYIPTRIVIERGRNTQSSGIRDFDFSAQGADLPPPLAIQRPSLATGEVFQGTVQYQTSRGQVAILGYGQDLTAYAPVPPALTQPGDAWVYSFQAIGQNQSRVLQGSGTEPPGPLAPSFPSTILPFDLASSGGSLPRLSLAWNAVTPAPNVHEVVITQQVQNKQAYCYLYFGKSWHGGAAHLAWAQPDLSAVPGFDPGFFPQAGVVTQVALYQSGSLTGQASKPFLGDTGWRAALLAPPATAAVRAEMPGGPGLRLRFKDAVKAASSSPWTEYWAVNRVQTILP